jgi:hypothetical protein
MRLFLLQTRIFSCKYMVLLKKEKGAAGVMYYHVGKNMTDAQADRLIGSFVTPKQIDLILDHDANVYDASGGLLLLFRKSRLPAKNTGAFYDSTIRYVMSQNSSNRSYASGHNNTRKRTGHGKHMGARSRSHLNIAHNPRVNSNIIGFFDKIPIFYSHMLKMRGVVPKYQVRETAFNIQFPDQYKRTVPLIRDINRLYRSLVPAKYAAQAKKAAQIPVNLKIAGTVFTTATINVNYQTGIHKDKGDDVAGFGNLAVIERGKYTGGETCFPQYGVGVDVRTGDILFMNVHEYHGNLPMKMLTADARRLSIVCYLREKIWSAAHGVSAGAIERHLASLRAVIKKGTKE